MKNMRLAIDMHEGAERVSICYHKSFLFHGAIYKVTSDILRVGDVWSYDLSPLELHNAELKRTARTGGAKRLEMSSSGVALKPMRGAKEGPAQLVTTRGYNTTMAISCLKKLLAKAKLRLGDGLIRFPDSRRGERLFGESGSGRLTLSSSGRKPKVGLPENDPRSDSTVSAFIRLLARLAEESAASDQ